MPKTVAGEYDRRDDYDIWRGLGLQLGQEADWPWETLEALYDPLPQYREPAASPHSRANVAEEYPFNLTTGGRYQPCYHSEHRQVASMRRMHPDPIVQIHPQTAAASGIQNDDWV